MKAEKCLMLKIFLLAGIFLISSGCSKDAAEDIHISPLLVSLPSPTINQPALSNSDSPIRKIDFENFTYPWTEGLAGDTNTFTLKNGNWNFENETNGLSFGKVVYGDLDSDNQEEAIISIGVRTGGSSMPNMIYIYTVKNQKTKLLWSFDTGDRAEGGLKKVYAENGELIVELFGDSKFLNGKWESRIPEGKFSGLCCPTIYTKTRFKWNGKKFVVEGKPELLDYNPKKQEN